MVSSGVVSTSRSTERTDSASPSRRATQGRVGAWTRVKMMTRTKTRLKMRAALAVPSVAGTVASTIGTAPRRPAQDRKAWSRSGIRNGVSETSTDSGRATSSRTSPMRRAGPICSGSSVGEASRPSMMNSPIWAIEPSAGREAVHGRPVRQPEVPEHEGREVCGDEARRVDGGGDRIREDDQADDPDGEQRRRGSRHASQEPRSGPADQQPDHRPADQLDARLEQDVPPGVVLRRRNRLRPRARRRG